jgi:hypothetical protein
MAASAIGLLVWHNMAGPLKAYGLTTDGAVTDVFGWVGTFGAFGFLGAYFLVSIASWGYLKKIGELTLKHKATTIIAVVLLMVPAVGSVYTNPPLTPPVKYFPYVFLTYLAIGLILCLSKRAQGDEVVESVRKDLEVGQESPALVMEPVGSS